MHRQTIFLTKNCKENHQEKIKLIVPDKYYIFYDGDCGFCNFWVQWILENDKKDQFLFAPLQSDFAQNFLKERGLERKQFNTIYLWKPKEFYLTKSKAITKIGKILGGKYAIMANLNLLPSFFSDKIYDKISENRQKLASQKCLLPNEDERKKFIGITH